jgi:hypothetical protein
VQQDIGKGETIVNTGHTFDNHLTPGIFTQGKQEGHQQISNHRCVQFTSYVSVLVSDTSCYPDLAVFHAWTVAFRFVN